MQTVRREILSIREINKQENIEIDYQSGYQWFFQAILNNKYQLRQIDIKIEKREGGGMKDIE